MNCISPTWIRAAGVTGLQPLSVNCGRCLPCRMNKAHEWSIRLLHTLDYYDKSCWICLTYDSKFLPENNSLKKSHVQDWLKRLRSYYPDRKIKYYLCGEYGSDLKTSRPHYHVILFGINKDDLELEWIGNQRYVVSGGVKDSWRSGLIHYDDVNYYSCKYTCGYIEKKFFGELEEKFINLLVVRLHLNYVVLVLDYNGLLIISRIF